ncbi:zinc ribbon domain-containing protein [bacterium]|nr:zinc ribbon domain-containing protein [bacterium]
MFCNKCGNILPENAEFCNKCGNSLSKVMSAEISQEVPTNNQVLPQANIHILGNSHKYQTVFYFLLTLLVPSVIALIFGVYSSYRANYYFQDEEAVNCISSGGVDCEEEVIDDDENNTIKTKFDDTSDINDFEEQAETMLVSQSKQEKNECNDTEALSIEETIKNTTGVLTSNFCGIDKDYLRQVEVKLKDIYNKHPHRHMK